MLISDKHFEEFKILTREHLGEEEYSKLTEQELLDSAIKLINLVRIIYKPIPKTEDGKIPKE